MVDGFRVFARYDGEGYGAPSYDGMPVPSGGIYQVDFEVDDTRTVYFVATAYNQTQESVLSNEITRLPPFCGDGELDPGETCDDGNTAGGDGCRADCTLELCGDGALDPGEQCDDGNLNNNDGCDATCQIEDPAVCGDGDPDPGELCDDGNLINGDGCSSICTLELCGDGIVDPGEQCDDGNTANGDGCDATCTIEAAPVCGDGVLDPGEECDDGNTANGDGCDATCTVEVAPVCGDGILDPGEQCDDGNNIDGDGCDATCVVEVAPVCGDGILDPGEQCDDGNTSNGDGCDATCLIEIPVCGDGTLDPGEQCDDGNTANGDGCDANCFVEVAPVCGNGVLDPGEQCDDGNTSNGDGCDAQCGIEVLDPPTLLLNPDFDTNMQMTGWAPFQGRAEWAALDIDGMATSGSTRIRNRSGLAGVEAGIYSECLAVAGGAEYTFGSWGYKPAPDQASTVSASVVWFSDPGCQEQVGDDTVSAALVDGTWVLAEGSAEAPSGARSAVMEVYSTKGSYNNSTLFTYVDAVSFVPEPGPATTTLFALASLALTGRGRRRRPQRDAAPFRQGRGL